MTYLKWTVKKTLCNLKKYVNDPVSTEELKQMLRKKYN